MDCLDGLPVRGTIQLLTLFGYQTEAEELLKLRLDCWGDCSSLSKVIALRF